MHGASAPETIRAAGGPTSPPRPEGGRLLMVYAQSAGKRQLRRSGRQNAGNQTTGSCPVGLQAAPWQAQACDRADGSSEHIRARAGRTGHTTTASSLGEVRNRDAPMAREGEAMRRKRWIRDHRARFPWRCSQCGHTTQYPSVCCQNCISLMFLPARVAIPLWVRDTVHLAWWRVRDWLAGIS